MNFMKKVIAFNIVLAHIPNRAKAAPVILLKMQTDRSQIWELQFIDSFRMKQIDFDMKAKTLDTSMLLVESGSTLKETKQPQISQ